MNWKTKLLISGNFERKKMGDPILEMAGLWIFCDYCFVGCQMSAANYFKGQLIKYSAM